MGGAGPRPSRFNPEVDPVRRVFEQGGQALDIGAIPDLLPVVRSGKDLIGQVINQLREGGGQVLDIGAIPDLQPVARSGTDLVGLQPFEIASMSEGDDTGDLGAAVGALTLMGSGPGALVVFTPNRTARVLILAEVMGRYSGSSGQFGHFEVFLTLDGLLASDAIGRSAHYLPVNAGSDGLSLGWSGTPHGFNFKHTAARTVDADALLTAATHTVRLFWQTRTGHGGSAFCRHFNIRVFAVPNDWSVAL